MIVQDTFCVRIVVILELNFVEVKTLDEEISAENGTASAGDINHITKALKYLI